MLRLWFLRHFYSLEDLEWEILTRKVLAVEKSWRLQNRQSESKKQPEGTTGRKSKKSSKASGSKGRVPRGVRPTSSGLETLPSGEIVIPTREVRGRLISYETPNGIGGLVECPPRPRPSEFISPRSRGSGTRA